MSKPITCVVLVAVGWICGCQNMPPEHSQVARAGVTHIVVCWQKHPGDLAERKILLGAVDSLKLIPGVVGVRVGSVMPSTRPVVDSSYDLIYVITFADAKALADYSVNPIHLQLKREVLDPNVEKIKVYDLKMAE